MLKKILAAVGAFALTLGMVVLVAGPANSTPPTGVPTGNPHADDLKVTICHYDEGQGGKWTDQEVSASSIIEVPNGHDTHPNDIIPSFDYTDDDDVLQTYPGKNISDAYHQWILANDCSNDVTPPDVLFTQATCDAPGGYTIPADTYGIIYTVTVNGGSGSNTPGFHALAIGDVVSVVATADTGFDIPNQATDSWGPFTIIEPVDCDGDIEVAVSPASATDQTCIADEENNGSYITGYITIPNTAHVKYYIDGTLASAGNHNLAPGNYQVTAVADDGYVLTGYDGPWNLTIDAAAPCGDLDTDPVVTPFSIFVQETCQAKGTYTIGTEEEIPGSVIWTVSGGLPNSEGKHSVPTPGIVTVTAEPAEGYGFPGDDPEMKWSYEFEAATGCDLTTLPLTGATPAAGLGIAGMLLLGGALIVAARERRVRNQA